MRNESVTARGTGQRAGGLTGVTAVLGLMAVLATPGLGQNAGDSLLSRALGDAAVTRALDRVGRAEARAVETLIALASIVSPSGREHERAAAVGRRMRQIGLQGVSVDSIPNVLGMIRGTSGRALVFVTMLDDLPGIEALQRSGQHRPRRQGPRVLGPATELQSAVAAMLTGAEALAAAGVQPHHDLVFAAVAQEETGLLGMQALFRALGERAVGFVEILGDGREIHDNAEGTTVWWRVEARGREGHTSDRSVPSLNRAIAEAVSAILALPHPERDRDRETFINVGVIRSGEHFNRKPETGWFSLDVRSRDRAVVEDIQREITAILGRVGGEAGVELHMVPDLQSWGAEIPGARDSALTRTATAVSRHLGYEPALTDVGCCNMRVAIAGGKLAIALHGDRGGDRGTEREWADIPAMMNMARQVVLLAGALGGR